VARIRTLSEWPEHHFSFFFRNPLPMVNHLEMNPVFFSDNPYSDRGLTVSEGIGQQVPHNLAETEWVGRNRLDPIGIFDLDGVFLVHAFYGLTRLGHRIDFFD
jgi:hypothetical protein